MSKETEKKIQLNSSEVEGVIKKCELLFDTKIEPYLQCDEYFDRSDGLLQKEDYTVRFRTDNLPLGNLFKIAVKGPRIILGEEGYSRIDIEFSALSSEEFYAEVDRKGLTCVVKLEKQRWKYKKDGIKLTIDKYPFIGFYLEVETLDIKQIKQFIDLLDLSSKQSVTKNSTELLEEKLQEIGLPIRPNLIATFELERHFDNTNIQQEIT